MTPQQNAVQKRERLAPVSVEIVNRLNDATTFAVDAFNAQGAGGVMAALNAAQGIADLQELFDTPEIKARILALQDKAIGFRTDRDPAVTNRKTNQPNVPYSWPVVRDCSIEATLRGLQLVGNQMNIISGRMYCTKEGYEGLIRKLGNVTNFEVTMNVPKAAGNGVLVDCEGAWLQDGQPRTIKATIPVKSDDYSTIEQSLGKATRKFLKRCYQRMTGKTVSDGDAGDADEIPQDAKPAKSSPPAPEFAKRSTKPKAEPTQPQPDPEPAADPTKQLSTLQQGFADLCSESGVEFDDAMGWLKTSGRWPQSDNAEHFGDVPDPVLEKLTASPNDVAKMVKLFGKAGGK